VAISVTQQELATLESLFDKGGRQGAGGLEVDEFIKAMGIATGENDPGELTEKFQKIDVNNDENLEWREYINYMLYSNMAQLSMHENDRSQEYIPKPLPTMTFHRNHTVMQIQKMRFIQNDPSRPDDGVLVSTSKEGAFKVWTASNLAYKQSVQVGMGTFALTDIVPADKLKMLVVCSIEGGVSFYRFDNLNMRTHREQISGVPLCCVTWVE